MEKRHVNWNELLDLITKGANEIKESAKDIDTIVSLARGGSIPATIIGRELNIKRIFSLGIAFYDRNNTKKKCPEIYQPLPSSLWSSNILVVDDIVDSGESMQYATNCIYNRYHTDREVLTYSIFFKRKACIIPRFYSEIVPNDTWLIFAWEKDDVV